MKRDEEILAKIVARYERAKKENGSKVTCAASRLSTPKERMERHQGFLAGLLTAEEICREVIQTSVINPWHKVSEELPNYATRVEIVHQIGNDMDIHIGVLLPLPDKQIWKIDDGRCLNENEVTHWRQLPELPKED